MPVLCSHSSALKLETRKEIFHVASWPFPDMLYFPELHTYNERTLEWNGWDENESGRKRYELLHFIKTGIH